MGNMSAPSYASPPMRSLVDPGVAEAVIDADGRGNKVLDLAAGNGRKLQFEHPRHRHVFDQDLLRLLVDFLALGIRGCDRAFGEQLVDRWTPTGRWQLCQARSRSRLWRSCGPRRT